MMVSHHCYLSFVDVNLVPQGSKGQAAVHVIGILDCFKTGVESLLLFSQDGLFLRRTLFMEQIVLQSYRTAEDRDASRAVHRGSTSG